MNIVIQYDSSVNTAPSGFTAAVQAAVSYMDNLITTPITVPIVFSYGEIDGQAMASGALGESEGNGWFLNYSQVKQYLASTATSADDIVNVLNMPANDPTTNGTWWVTDAQAKAFGITGNPSFQDPEDGFIGLTSKYPLAYPPGPRAVSGSYDAVGILEHEITEVLGRTSGLASWTNGGQNVYTPLDLSRYSSTGVRDFTGASGGSFSVDGKTMLSPYNSASSGADLGDWGSSVVGDSFGYGFAGIAGLVSTTDQREMDVLGYTLSTTTGTPSVALTYSQFVADTTTLGQFTTAFNLTVSGVAVAKIATVEAAAHVAAVQVSDSAANIAADLDALNADGKVNKIVVADNASVVITAAQQTADAKAISELINANGTAATVVVSGGGGGSGGGAGTTYTNTAANISANFDSLNGNSTYSSIVISDNAAVTLTAAQLQNDTHALGELANANGSSYALTVKDTAANITAALGALNGSAHVTSIVDSNNLALTLNAATALADAHALGELSYANGGSAVVNISDTAANLSAALDGLSSTPHLGSITISDGGAIKLSVAQLSSDAAALAKITGTLHETIADTGADISAALSTLRTNTHITAMTVTNGAMVVLPYSQYSLDATLLNKITGVHTIETTGVSSTISAQDRTYNGTAVTELMDHFTNNTLQTWVYASGQTVGSSNETNTIRISSGLSGETFTFATGMASEIIAGYVPGSDSLNFSSALFSSSSAVLAAAANDGHGGVVITVAPGVTIDLTNVTLSSIQAHVSDFHISSAGVGHGDIEGPIVQPVLVQAPTEPLAQLGLQAQHGGAFHFY